MSQPCQIVCSPWATLDDVCGPCTDPSDPDLLISWMNVASDLLFHLSGRQFPGICQDTFRPRVTSGHDRRMLSDYSPSRVVDGSDYPCRWVSPYEVDLGVYPVTSVDQVLVNGVALDATRYRVDDYRYLVRLRDADGSLPAWPGSQSHDPANGAFEVTVSYGKEAPRGGVKAAAVLGCEFYLSCVPELAGQCRLPKRVQSITRQGVSMVVLDSFEFLEQGRLGIPEVDFFLMGVNPHKLRNWSQVINPDTLPSMRRAGT